MTTVTYTSRCVLHCYVPEPNEGSQVGKKGQDQEE